MAIPIFYHHPRFAPLHPHIGPCRRLHLHLPRCSVPETPQETVREQTNAQASSSAALSPSPGGRGRLWLAVGAVGIAAAAVIAGRVVDGGPALARLQQASVPLEAAQFNDRPTVLEFYADWCEVCQELAPATLQVEEAFRGRVNFVMLNVDNSKWAPEVAEYGVRGIPHYVFLDGKGTPQAAAVGRLPRKVLEGNVSALADAQPLPYRSSSGGAASSLSQAADTLGLRGPPQAGPRDHA